MSHKDRNPHSVLGAYLRFRDVSEIAGFRAAVPKVRVHLPPAESRANHRFQPPVVKRLGEDETLVALRRDFRTSLAIAADALGTEIGQKRARFAWDVGPGVGVWCRKRGAFGTCFALTSP